MFKILSSYRSERNPSAQTADLSVDFPAVDELIARAERLTDSCIHPDQVLVSRNFIMNVARRAALHKKYTDNDLWRVGILVEHMAKTRARKLCALGGEILH